MEETIVAQWKPLNPKSVITFSHALSGIKEHTHILELGILFFVTFSAIPWLSHD